MGIGLTLQQVEGWEGQYERMQRWYERARTAAQGSDGQDEMDFVLVLFQHMWTLRDWIYEACPEARAALEALFRDNLELRLCRDIANGFKHMTLSKPSVDGAFSIVFEHNPRGRRLGNMVVLAGGHKFELLELASKGVSLWSQFIRLQKLRRSSAAAKADTIYS
jgi:hypothetical protein